MNKEIIKFENVYFSYGNNLVLEDINFSVRNNEYVALMGPNGGGKSTMLKIMLGIIKPDKGIIKIFDKNPLSQRQKMGYLAQYSSFDFSFPISVFDLVLMGRYRIKTRYYGIEDKEAVFEALKKVNMEAFTKRHINTLSGGQLQRTLIARAIVKKPEILLLDEPMSGVDPQAQKSIYDILIKLNKDMAIILITHDTSVVSSDIGSVACLNRSLFYHGKAEGSLGKLAQAYKCPVEIISHGIPHRVLGEHSDD
ncbi:MAG: metal ABC transporter ATP-binding protein [Candidatus Humimicrobiaceae bacterium]